MKPPKPLKPRPRLERIFGFVVGALFAHSVIEQHDQKEKTEKKWETYKPNFDYD